MTLTEALQRHKKNILSLWIERTLDSYTSPGFFKKAKDPFANPVGANTSQALEKIFELLIDNAEAEAYTEPLDQMIRMRAVQSFTPAQAVAPLLELKWVIKQIFKNDSEVSDLLDDMDEFDCEVDRIALAGFNNYVECREQLYRCRINELKSGSHVITDSGCPSKVLKDQPGPTGLVDKIEC